MEKRKEKWFLKSDILKIAVLFICSYLIFLLVWVRIEDYYGMAITSIASYCVTSAKNVRIQRIERKKGVIEAWFVPERYGVANILININVSVSLYSFNTPLTFAIMTAFYPFLRRKRIYLDAVAILVLVHILYVFSFEGDRLTAAMVTKGYERMSEIKFHFWKFLFGFTGSMLIRFEPFLIGAYIYIRKDSALSLTSFSNRYN
jgi:hypothetical protein